jgi:hypothetical protein
MSQILATAANLRATRQRRCSKQRARRGAHLAVSCSAVSRGGGAGGAAPAAPPGGAGAGGACARITDAVDGNTTKDSSMARLAAAAAHAPWQCEGAQHA